MRPIYACLVLVPVAVFISCDDQPDPPDRNPTGGGRVAGTGGGAPGTGGGVSGTGGGLEGTGGGSTGTGGGTVGTGTGGGTVGTGGGITGTGGGVTGTGGGVTGTGGGSEGTGGGSGPIATTANLKIAFFGDSDDGTDYRNVLRLIKAEGAEAIVTAGDMTYGADPATWWTATEAEMGASFPIFLARGNHDDSSWGGFLPKAATHMGGATRTAGPHDAAYKTVFKGLSIVTIKKGDSGAVIRNLFNGDRSIWKICDWHQNQNRMQIGGKGDEMGWDVYEACRENGAIIITGHEHSYERTKTLTNMQNRTVDTTCSDSKVLCNGPGKTWAVVTGLGGTGIRDQMLCLPATPPYGCPEWASIYTSNQNATYGALFLVFNTTEPKKARGYFKNVANQVIDDFTITAQ